MGVREDFERCIAGGGVVVFPADTVYGLACDPQDEAAVRRLYALKGRAPDKPAATMYFSVDALPPLPPRVAAAARALLPGPVTLVVGPLGLRVPDLPLLQGAAVSVLQSSANHAGGPEARRLEDVPQDIRRGADLVLDGGELPGTPSTVLDLTRYEDDGTWTILREGAVPAASLADVL
jgi:L-threonylcarbamoyladenylate synthase